MAYFQQNAFPANFNTQPAFQQPYQPPISQNNMIWVSGEQEMRSYQVGPNATVPLWDSENPVIYLKSADMMGKPSVKVLDYTAAFKCTKWLWGSKWPHSLLSLLEV